MCWRALSSTARSHLDSRRNAGRLGPRRVKQRTDPVGAEGEEECRQAWPSFSTHEQVVQEGEECALLGLEFRVPALHVDGQAELALGHAVDEVRETVESLNLRRPGGAFIHR